MAYYNVNRVIKLTRKALGLTQEKLSEGICEVETYSRIENGRRTIRRSTYRKLMEKMGRIADRRYAVCVSKDGMLLEEKVELERAFKRYDYEAAEKYLKILKEKADDNLLTRQYIARVDALVEYRCKRITAKELAVRLDAALRMTVPEYETYMNSGRTFAFFVEEIQLLMNLGNAYRRSKDFDESIHVYKYILRCLEENYIGEPIRTNLYITIVNSISAVYEILGKYQDAISQLDVCLELVAQNDYGHLIPVLMSAKAYNIMRLVDDKCMGNDNIIEAKKISQYAFYIATARCDANSISRIDKFYREFMENDDFK